MDIKRTKKRPWAKWTIGSLVLLGLAAVGYLASTSSYASSVTVDRQRVSITPVVEAPFYEYINVSGQFEPQTSFLLDVKVPGTVERILAESGQEVETGDVLLELANDDLRLEVMQRESQLIEQLNNQRQTALLLNQNNYNQREQLVEVRYQIDLQRKQYERNMQLLSDSVIARSDFEPIEDRYHYLRRRHELLQESYRTDSLARIAQLDQINNSETRILENLEAVRAIIDRLRVTALTNGQLSDFAVQPGQALAIGDRLGEIYQMNNPLIVARVDEYYLDKVSIGQPGIAILDGDTLDLRVDKIFPNVEEGRFRVEISLQPGHQQDHSFIKGQSVRVRLFFGEPTERILVTNGNFYNTTGGNWVYLIDGDQAVKTSVELGRKNPRFYEVLSGLVPGDRVITSGYEAFQDYEIIKLNH
jgi:HlyD family secretion protein